MVFSIIIIVISKIIKERVKIIKLRYKIQEGNIKYSDLNRPGKSFFSKRYKLTGKPDYIIIKNNKYIPVEFKTGFHKEPLKNHIFQLAGYCHLIEENYGGFVPYGILVYNNTNQFKISYDPKVRFELELTLKNMRHIIKTDRVSRNHNDPNRCKNCSMRINCNTNLL